MRVRNTAMVLLVLCGWTMAQSRVALDVDSLELTVGAFHRLQPSQNAPALKYSSSDEKVAAVYSNGYVIALSPGTAVINAAASDGAGAQCKLTVESDQTKLIDPSTLQQYPDNRVFKVGNRKCVGTVLNGHMVGNESRHERNRVTNPHPLSREKPLEWELVPNAPVFDGAGVPMGTAAAATKIGDRKVTTTAFNYGFSKVIDGKLCLYAFTVDIKPNEKVRALLPEDQRRKSVVATSAWVALDSVVEKELLLEEVGLGKGKLPKLPLLPIQYKVTGGNPEQYVLPQGEVSIVKDVTTPPVPSHYLRRPTGTVNIIYCVPGFDLGGQSLDSFLVSDGVFFQPAKGVRPITVPTYFPMKHPQAGKKSPKTMTFIYGAVLVKGSETIYGWVAKEALAAER